MFWVTTALYICLYGLGLLASLFRGRLAPSQLQLEWGSYWVFVLAMFSSASQGHDWVFQKICRTTVFVELFAWNFWQIVLDLSKPTTGSDEFMGAGGSLSFLFMIKLMVWYFVSNVWKVVTMLILGVLILLDVAEWLPSKCHCGFFAAIS